MKRLIVSAGFIFMTLSIPQNGIARKHTISLTQETVAYTPIVPLEKANKNQHRSAKKHKQQLKKGNAMSAKNGSIIIGIALLLMGLLVLWYLSIILGIFISLGGLVLLIIGIGIKGDKNPDVKNKKRK